MSYIIKLYARYGTASGTDKPYTATYYYPVFELTQEEFDTIQAGDIMTGRPPALTARGEVLNNLIQFSLAANDPQIVFDTRSRDFTEFINYANACGFITGSSINTVVNFSGSPYVDIAADADFTTLLVNNVQTNSAPANELAYLFYSLSSTNGAAGKYPFIIKVGDLYYLSRFLVQYNNNNFYGANISVFRHYANIDSILSNIEPYVPQTDPYAPGGISGEAGGGGTFDLTSDSVDFPALPTLTAVSTGLVSIYTPTLAQLNSLASYMWNANPTDIDWWKKLVANPLDLILGLSIVPVSVPAGATQNVKVGLIDTGIAMTKAATQFVEVDCGSIEVKEFWGSALDYSPFRKFSIYLPFIGTRTINTDDIMGKVVAVKYHVDLLSGALTALVKCGDAVLYQYSGACAVSLPLSGETFTSMITSTIQLAASVAGTIASGGAAAGVAVASAANSVMSMKPQIERAGGVSGAAGQLGVMKPYLIGEVPRQSVPENYNTFVGYPSNIKATLGDLTGFTSVETIHLQNIPATAAEYAEIEQLLKDGVII